MSSYSTVSIPVAPAAATEGFTARMIRLWIEHYERLLGFNIEPL